jgi:hypothetical protein
VSEKDTSTTEVQKTKRQASVALVGLLVVVLALGAAFVVFDGAQFVADLLSGDEIAESDIPPKPALPSGDAVEPSEEPTESVEPTTPADTSTSGVTEPTVVAPTGDQLARMFWEQAASQEQIGKLVAGEISSFSLGGVSNNGTTASVRVTANYKAGGSLSGTMVLRNYSGVWYFSSITRDGNTGASVKSIPADTGITSTIVAQTASNQDIPNAIISGGYKTCTINSVSGGSGTATIGMTLSGGTSPRVSGQIVCVSKVIGGTKYWFITSFRRS